MTSIDHLITEILYSFASENSAIRAFVIFFGHWSGYAITPAFFAWAIWFWRKNAKAAILAQTALAAISSRIVLEIIRFIWDIKRPFVRLGVSPLFEPFENGPSFPSGHATFYFALAAVSWSYSKKTSAALFAAAFLMGIARVAAGVHWPTDILAGAVLGIAAGYLAKRVISLF
jgi:undecaprenyl-diphosphatase